MAAVGSGRYTCWMKVSARAGRSKSIPHCRPSVIRVLEQVVTWSGQPQAIRLDNGPEFRAERFTTWCAWRGIELRYIQPGKPDQNAFIERYNRTYRTEVPNASVFESLDQVREISAEWLQSDNEERPHEAWRASRRPLSLT